MTGMHVCFYLYFKTQTTGLIFKNDIVFANESIFVASESKLCCFNVNNILNISNSVFAFVFSRSFNQVLGLVCETSEKI